MGLSRTEFLYVESVAAVCDAHRFNRIACSATRDFGLPFKHSLVQPSCLTMHAHGARCAFWSTLTIRASAARCACTTPHSTASRNHASRSGATLGVREAAMSGEAHPRAIV